MTTGFSAFDLTVLPAMVVGAIVGGFGGADLNKKLDMKTLDHAFNAVQLLVLALSAVNIVRNLL